MANEKRVIDANALTACFEEQCAVASKDSAIESLYTLAALKCCIDFFQNVPTMDAVEVVHGVWHGPPWNVSCDQCGCQQKYKYNYCPNCGAKMDGERRG